VDKTACKRNGRRGDGRSWLRPVSKLGKVDPFVLALPNPIRLDAMTLRHFQAWLLASITSFLVEENDHAAVHRHTSSGMPPPGVSVRLSPRC
jgi:hypothetical protein